MNAPGAAGLIEPHTMNPLAVLRMVKALGGNFRKLLLVGCEPADLGGEEGRMGLSEPVQAAVERAIGVIDSLVRALLEEKLSFESSKVVEPAQRCF